MFEISILLEFCKLYGFDISSELFFAAWASIS